MRFGSDQVGLQHKGGRKKVLRGLFYGTPLVSILLDKGVKVLSLLLAEGELGNVYGVPRWGCFFVNAALIRRGNDRQQE